MVEPTTPPKAQENGYDSDGQIETGNKNASNKRKGGPKLMLEVMGQNVMQFLKEKDGSQTKGGPAVGRFVA